MNKNYKCINSFILKMIAIITMVIDHVGAVLFPMNMMFRYIGRISFPLFVFLLVEGSIHTSKIRKYELRMFLFALISEIPFDLAFSNEIVDIHSQNVFWTLTIGLVMLDLIQNGASYVKSQKGKKLQLDWIEGQPIPTIWQFVVVSVCACVAQALQTDYGAGGILLIYFIWMLHENVIAQAVAFVIISLLFFGSVELPGVIAFLPIFLYNGKKGPSAKYVFYAFYPVHLFILHLIQTSVFFLFY
ncbi:TraX family protein [Eubacterium ramulus]